MLEVRGPAAIIKTSTIATNLSLFFIASPQPAKALLVSPSNEPTHHHGPCDWLYKQSTPFDSPRLPSYRLQRHPWRQEAGARVNSARPAAESRGLLRHK